MSDIEWTDEKIERWCRIEMRSLADSPCYRRAAAILECMRRLREAEEAAQNRNRPHPEG